MKKKELFDAIVNDLVDGNFNVEKHEAYGFIIDRYPSSIAAGSVGSLFIEAINEVDWDKVEKQVRMIKESLTKDLNIVKISITEPNLQHIIDEVKKHCKCKLSIHHYGSDGITIHCDTCGCDILGAIVHNFDVDPVILLEWDDEEDNK